MKVLYIAHYKEFGGWAQAATDYILALDKSGVDVVCRNVTLTQDKKGVNARLLELEKKSAQNPDVIIQHVLPHHLVGYEGCRNIAFLASESTTIKHLNWFENLKLMDEIWVPNDDAKDFLEADGITSRFGVPVTVIPHTTNTQKYKLNYEPISISEAKDDFKFYYIGDLNQRKNIESIVTCFHSEFHPSENVKLVLKLNKFGYSKEDLSKTVDQMLLKIKTDLRMYPDVERYKKDITICDQLSETDIMRLHQHCDCFVCPSHGEGWSIPSFDAMAFGNTPICSKFGGPKTFIHPSNWRTGHLIDGVFSCCKCQDAAFPDIFTSREYWFQPCEMQIRQSMRKAYESWKNNPVVYKNRNRQAGLKQAELFAYEQIANKMKEALCTNK